MSAGALMQKLGTREQKGSKPRCHWLTHGARKDVAARLTELAKPWGTVSEEDYWMPDGFCHTKEAELDKACKLVQDEADREKLCDWWLAVRKKARKPNWDIAATCTVGDKEGLLLVEAKAHKKEFVTKGKRLPSNTRPNSCENHRQIGKAINKANTSLMEQTGLCWKLSRDKHYQMSNRFAWAWKLTELGYSVVLVYLGFLNAREMKKPFEDDNCWEKYIKKHSQPLFPTEVWDQKRTLHDGCVFIPCIRSLTTPYNAPYE